ncbi:phage tail spike protein [Clostridium neonatale]|uniref:phage tail spike protein n=1 Tax=Clostridium neonatale TaxID=137838 RepID=UPI00291C33B5|nr:phage tail spike protein [Clostridium neonatale]CAI3193076.1 Prophage_tail domain-containing protein [Clostridium neonatale]CAI3197009.1 Prophage_tail domain-containing protein [Clostridium neonatale]
MASVRLYNSKETDFTHNENVLTEIESCKVTEELNGDYTVELEYPLDDSKDISNSLVVGAIPSVPAIDSRNNQLFRIIAKDTDSFSTTIQGQAKFLADLKENRVKAMTLTGLTRKQAIQTVLNAALEPHIYTVGNLDTNTNNDVIVNIQEGSVLSAIIGEENSILSEYGGEFIVNNDTIDIIDSRGSNNGVTIEYGKNLSSIKESIDLTDLATVLIPKSGDYRLPEYVIESPNVNKYEKRYFQEVEFSLDIWDGTDEQGEEQITEAEAYELMRATCNKMFSNDHVDQITFNYEVNMIELSKTEEYKDYAILETVNLGDTVTVKHKKLNLDLQGRVNKIVYRVNSEGETLLDTVEIGFKKKDITDIISDTVKSIQFAKNEIKLQVKNDIDKVNTELNLQDGKISAVVESNDGGMTWQLSKNAFIVACTGASNSNVTIDTNGLTVNNNKIKLKNSSGDTVFYVNTKGVCNAVGGFIVEDDDTTCEIDSTGILLTGPNGKTAKIEILDDGTYSGTYMRDDLYVEDVLRVFGRAKFEKGATFYDDDIEIGDETLEEYIIRIIEENA